MMKKITKKHKGLFWESFGLFLTKPLSVSNRFNYRKTKKTNKNKNYGQE